MAIKCFSFFGETGLVLEKGGKETQGWRHFYFRLVPPPFYTASFLLRQNSIFLPNVDLVLPK